MSHYLFRPISRRAATSWPQGGVPPAESLPEGTVVTDPPRGVRRLAAAVIASAAFAQGNANGVPPEETQNPPEGRVVVQEPPRRIGSVAAFASFAQGNANVPPPDADAGSAVLFPVGMVEGQLFTPGAQAGHRFRDGLQAGQAIVGGMQRGQGAGE